MTLYEAKIIGRIVSSADSGCPSCIRSLLDQLNEAFPEFTWNFDDDTYETTVTWRTNP